MTPEYYISESTSYEISCEVCSNSTGYFGSPEEVSKIAEGLGFIAIDTPDDGTLNFCRDCKTPDAHVAAIIQEGI